jgi:hypothetical protein
MMARQRASRRAPGTNYLPREKGCALMIDLNTDASANYARLSPHHLAALSVRRAADALERVASDPTTWFFVVLDLHRALHSALIAALSGTAGIGAYTDKLQAEWLEYLEKSRDDPAAKEPTGDRILPFDQLLSRVGNATPPLQLSPEQRADICKLNEFRGDLEHVKPKGWSLEVGGLPRMSASVVTAFASLLKLFSHRLEPGELEQLEAAISKFRTIKDRPKFSTSNLDTS